MIVAKRVVKPILEIRNANNVILFAWFMYSFSHKKFKNMQCKKE